MSCLFFFHKYEKVGEHFLDGVYYYYPVVCSRCYKGHNVLDADYTVKREEERKREQLKRNRERLENVQKLKARKKVDEEVGKL